MNLSNDFIVRFVLSICRNQLIRVYQQSQWIAFKKKIARYAPSSSIGLNISWICFTLGNRSGAPRSRPKIVLDLKDSDSSANFTIPLLSFLKAWKVSSKSAGIHIFHETYAHTQHFDEIFDATVLGMNTSHDTFQVRKAFGDARESISKS